MYVEEKTIIIFFIFQGAGFLPVMGPECFIQHLREREAAEWTDHQQKRREQHRQRQRLHC